MSKLLNPFKWPLYLQLLLILPFIFFFTSYIDWLDCLSKINEYFLGKSIINNVDTLLSFTGVLITFYFAIVAFDIAKKEFMPHISILIEPNGTTKMRNNSNSTVKIDLIKQLCKPLSRQEFNNQRQEELASIIDSTEEHNPVNELCGVELGNEEEFTIMNSATHIDVNSDGVEKLEDKDVWVVSTIIRYENFISSEEIQYIHAFINPSKTILMNGIRPFIHGRGSMSKELVLKSFWGISDSELRNQIHRYTPEANNEYITAPIDKYFGTEKEPGDKDIHLNPQQQWILVYKKKLN